MEEKFVSIFSMFGALSGFGIDKAYITHSRIQKLKTGDMIIFYKSESQILSVLGFIEKVITPQSTYDSIRSIFHKHNAYSQRELISEMETILGCSTSFL
jgi:predicted RNA-binding protein with PUA-like domain